MLQFFRSLPRKMKPPQEGGSRRLEVKCIPDIRVTGKQYYERTGYVLLLLFFVFRELLDNALEGIVATLL